MVGKFDRVSTSISFVGRCPLLSNLHMKNTLEKGTAKTATIALVILVIFIILGVVVYKMNDGEISDDNLTSTTTPTYTINDVTSTTTTGTKTGSQPTIPRTVAVVESPFPGGSVYHSDTYGLTIPLPAAWNGYSASISTDTYAGVSDLASIHLIGAASSLTINVFTKEQWNDIRIQETNGQVNSFGEGNYLGENKNYIFSSVGSGPDIRSILDRVRFY